jgi:hypothetical protein
MDGSPFAAIVRKMHGHAVFRQNARTREYMLSAAIAEYAEFPESRLIGPAELDTIQWADVSRLVLLWPDSNGLGWRPTEQKAQAVVGAHTEISVLNGRRRRFLLASAKQLYLRRFLEKSFLPDLALTVAFFVCSPFLLAADLVRGRK